jgi:hypothetical protein
MRSVSRKNVGTGTMSTESRRRIAAPRSRSGMRLLI